MIQSGQISVHTNCVRSCGTFYSTLIGCRCATARETKGVYCEGQSHETMSKNYNLFEEQGEPKRNRAETPLLNS